MGDLISQEVTGVLYYVPFKEFERIRAKSIPELKKAEIFAGLCRINTLYMIAKAGSGHIGSSFSSMDMLSWLYLNELQGDINSNSAAHGDIFFSSKGHDAPALYSVLIGLGKLDFELIHRLRSLGGLPGHPDIATPNIITNTGSLGMGVSKAKGMIFANKRLGKQSHAYVLTGDGELQEGQFWESLLSAANHKVGEITVIIDHNKLQSDTLVSKVSDLGDLEAKFAAFGWHVSRCNGNDLAAFSAVLSDLKNVKDKPKVIIADTTKGKGVSFMEHTSIDSDVEFYKFHSGAPSKDAYIQASKELIDAVNNNLSSAGIETLELESIDRPSVSLPENPQRLIPAYTEALLEQARKNPKLVALDADLILDTGLIPFRQEFPDRFLECGIAEQDMVSQAGGMAIRGLLPVVHSFACFLSTRPNEQIYNNATERTKIIYVGSLAGVVPGGPGHSHQAVRDIASLSAIPGLTLMEPSCEAEVSLLMDWAVNKNQGSTYLRLISIPVTPPYSLPAGYKAELGKGIALTEGSDAVIIAYGPVLLSGAVDAAEKFSKENGKAVKVINLPWLNAVDHNWLIDAIGSAGVVLSLDNHYSDGAQGSRIAEVIADSKKDIKLLRTAIPDVPHSGSNSDLLEKYSLNADGIYKTLSVHILA